MAIICLLGGPSLWLALLTGPGAPAAMPPAAPGWESYDEEGDCIGGSRCGDQGSAIRIAVEDAPVVGVRFHAHDQVGESAAGKLRVRLDATALAPDIDIADGGEVYDLPVKGLRGRFLILETRSDDEVVVEDLQIEYSGARQPRERREWRAYPEESGCIGGERCRGQGRTIRIALEEAPIYGIRFHAHDNVGPHTRGRLRVWIDRRSLARDLDIPRAGEVYNLAVGGVRGRILVFEAVTNDEVVVEDVEVQYAGLRAPWEKRPSQAPAGPKRP